MKPMLFAALTLASVLLSGVASQNASAQGLMLAQQQNCMSCHAIDRTSMGPALRDVAQRYASRDDAQAYLARKITEGSTSLWGPVPMPANTQLTPEQAATLASWILSLK
ncbi:c-type cytochrome [Paraburkholderia hayleyella]|uniref:c-type cytochrome n=1 Tax=Paraburkholderia hayleyella TaxID=2152889 RepID=UPI0012909B55|nr:c-type cytochrome [Paraburkholderia hayleyella]